MQDDARDIPWWSTSFTSGEAEAAASTIRDRHLSQGPVTQLFEEMLASYLGVAQVIAVTSGSSALLLSLIGHGVGPGDEVLVPNRTWIATAHAVHLLGAVPVFVDTEFDRPIMSVEDARRKVTRRTKAIMPVHLNGRSVDMDAIGDLADASGLVVIEDAAQALGSRDPRGRLLGTLSHSGCFSLSVAKIIATGQGGFIATNDEETGARLRAMRTHGVENTVLPDRWVMPGFNFRFTDVLASIGIVQLGLLDDRIVRAKEVNAMYRDGLVGCSTVHFLSTETHEVGPYIEVLAEDRASFIESMASQGIETRPFYPDLDSAPYWVSDDRTVNSRIFEERAVYLPSGPSISDLQIKRVLAAIRSL